VKKLLLGGIWVCAVTSASVYFASWNAGGASLAPEDAYLQGIDYVKTRQITVPRISEGRIQGYVIARFVFTVDAQTAHAMAVPPEIFVVDEAFRTIYGDENIDFDRLERVDLSGLTSTITQRVNERLQPELVKETLVEQFDYVPYSSLNSHAVDPSAHVESSRRSAGGAGGHAPAH
jgi:hypothetical protein